LIARRRRQTSPRKAVIVACPKLRSIVEDHKARRAALPRREQISDPEPPYELYQPTPPAAPTLFDKVQRVAFITTLSLLWPLVLTVIANALYDDIVPPTIEIILLVGCAISFCVAYFDRLFLEGDH
jgi:hypothetical protein